MKRKSNSWESLCVFNNYPACVNRFAFTEKMPRDPSECKSRKSMREIVSNKSLHNYRLRTNWMNYFSIIHVFIAIENGIFLWRLSKEKIARKFMIYSWNKSLLPAINKGSMSSNFPPFSSPGSSLFPSVRQFNCTILFTFSDNTAIYHRELCNRLLVLVLHQSCAVENHFTGLFLSRIHSHSCII